MPSLTQRLGLPRYEADRRYKDALTAYLRAQDARAEARNDALGQALAIMNEVIEMLPTHAEYWAARGMIYIDQNKLEPARADFERAVKLFDLELLGHYGLGLVAYHEERYPDALRHLLTAERIDPQRTETLYTLALVLDKLERSAEAVERMTRAHDLMEAHNDKRKPQAVRWLAQIRKHVKA
ncbi:MAG: tetratricopeptide repeat protein [Anaerolineae bacterium]|jgi:Flp pilus assembly protein TadD|nr:tetratricopeptide repeat protein [Anaerolineae bacterium]